LLEGEPLSAINRCCHQDINIANIWGDYAKMDGVGKGKC
ncbi:hypothetical protein T4B_10594, partial [Trichinella pseudospiralis]